MNRTLFVLSFCTFTSALSTRAVDPVIPQIAADFWVSPSTAAMLATAFAAYGLVQPVLGPVADAVGKTRVMIVCLTVLAICSFLTAIVTDFWLLLILRTIAGGACGGSFPVAMAILSDLVPMGQRQIMIGRLLAATISGNLLGSAAAGVVADMIHWRGVFVILGFVTLLAIALAVVGLRSVPKTPPQPLDARTVVRRFRVIFGIPAARVCYIAVFLEGVFLFGLFPYVAILLTTAGEPRAAIAGLVIGAFALGGIIYSLSVGWMLTAFGQKAVMMAGAIVMALSVLSVAFQPVWQWQCLAFAAMGCGFYMLHASIQVYVTELAPESRSSSVAFHTFSFFIGQGIGPIAFGIGLTSLGTPPTLVICAVALLVIGVISANLLVRPKPPVVPA